MSKFLKKIKIIKPDDWHVHLRDNEILKKVSQYTGTFYKRAIIMPNLEEPITNCFRSISYRRRILNSMTPNTAFQPLMICYLTEKTSPEELQQGFFKKIFVGAKLYPHCSTTNSKYGIKNINNIYHLFNIMEKIKMPLLIHGEENNLNIDIYDREAKFIENTLKPLRKKFPELKIILEHITTEEAISYIEECNSSYLAGTITPHHLMLNRNNMFIDGIQPHLYCLPLLKRKKHQIALRNVISSGSKNFFLGSDTAPHFHKNKINTFGCAGIFNAPSSLLCYVSVFEEMNALQHFQSFCSENGPNFYNMPINKETITLVKKPHKILEKINIGKNIIVPFLAGKRLDWSIEK
ncbi:dihydroorotase [Buchnera aphidicola]|jgi:dihydroorotase|uniref:Dihydroorotase n=1 Tax=Buchnera aphidicola subsp. Schizaphis graminum (strain Sg) TaxID=198804 RepID=PYRC_BUCAP|nr:dihydroorotase [Buchnera aphidicola]Q8K9L2.1 RecName: Full=Dihydroorotase; Short=DHOase [Buchnera aphidicola str. Sg (Schizaphis graminum)]AAM67876.1 dihydroorotase [Buchnera aphidicola str. Sg (Schizaphis graminum)]AWI49629.1 dihydroorotase [Buchnera aphidicola (Schizaphis graminum)]